MWGEGKAAVAGGLYQLALHVLGVGQVHAGGIALCFGGWAKWRRA